ncbi:hypothetical protein BH10PLA2_BH10PLA2_31180 [soil metagenome]
MPGARGMLWPLIILTVLIVVGIALVVWMDRWRKRPIEVSLTPAEQLAHFQQLLDRGELSQQEFDRIKAKLNLGLLSIPPVPPHANGSAKA